MFVVSESEFQAYRSDRKDNARCNIVGLEIGF